MALAGNMKLKHFLLLVGAAGAAVVGGAFYACDDDPEPATPERRAAAPTPTPSPTPPPTPTPTPTPPPVTDSTPTPAPPAPAGRAVDADVMRYRGRNLGTSKQKDVTKGKPYKVNVYQDEGFASVNRAKVDLDRDDKWDEKWTFDGDDISRKVAPDDDENYTESTVWNGTEWVTP